MCVLLLHLLLIPKPVSEFPGYVPEERTHQIWLTYFEFLSLFMLQLQNAPSCLESDAISLAAV